jgi:hypothetical protein
MVRSPELCNLQMGSEVCVLEVGLGSWVLEMCYVKALEDLFGRWNVEAIWSWKDLHHCDPDA